MTENLKGVINPVQVVKDTLSLWLTNFIPLAAINAAIAGIHMSLSAALRSCGPMQRILYFGEANISAFVLIGLFVIAIVAINSFLVLVALNYLCTKREGRPYLVRAVKEAVKKFARFLKSFLLLWAFITVGLFVAFFFLAAGKGIYHALSQSSAHGTAMGTLLATSTIFVVMTIATFWYGFFFSFAPIIAAYENAPVFYSFKASRDRIRGNAFRYLLALVAIVALYFFVGLGVYWSITRFTHNKVLLNTIDPIMFVIIGPIVLAGWYAGYKKLTELKSNK